MTLKFPLKKKKRAKSCCPPSAGFVLALGALHQPYGEDKGNYEF